MYSRDKPLGKEPPARPERAKENVPIDFSFVPSERDRFTATGLAPWAAIFRHFAAASTMIAMPQTQTARPLGFIPLGIFFFFAASMASLAAITLGWPGTFLDRAWELNKSGHAQLATLGRFIALPFGILALFAFVNGIGWFQRRRWAWIAGVSGIAVNLVGDLINMAFGEFWKGAAGVVIAGLLLFYMTRPSVGGYFQSGE